MEEKINKKAVIDMIRKVPVAHPSDDFTERVMVRVGLRAPRRGAVAGVREFLTRPLDVREFRLFPERITKGHCAFYCILVSLFYLVMGMVFARSLESMGSAGYQAIWLLHQPDIAFAVAIGFALLGVSFVSNRPLSARSARIGILCFLGAIIVNNIMLQLNMRIPIVALALLPFTIGGVIIGGFLMNAMERYSGNAG